MNKKKTVMYMMILIFTLGAIVKGATTYVSGSSNSAGMTIRFTLDQPTVFIPSATDLYTGGTGTNPTALLGGNTFTGTTINSGVQMSSIYYTIKGSASSSFTIAPADTNRQITLVDAQGRSQTLPVGARAAGGTMNGFWLNQLVIEVSDNTQCAVSNPDAVLGTATAPVINVTLASLTNNGTCNRNAVLGGGTWSVVKGTAIVAFKVAFNTADIKLVGNLNMTKGILVTYI